MVRTLVVVAVVVLLVRAALGAWQNRRLSLRVWSSVRTRHVLASLALLAGVLGTFFLLVTLVPVTGYGLGRFIGLTGNAVFAPIEGALQDVPAISGAPAARTFPWLQAGGVLAFLALLVVLFPFLAFGEERAFRAGLEHASGLRLVWASLRFGLIHLVMLIPLAAALGIALAGFGYGLAYRHRYHRALAQLPPIAVPAPAASFSGATVTALELRPDTAGARAAALLESTTYHMTFNTLIALVVAVGYLTSLVLP